MRPLVGGVGKRCSELAARRNASPALQPFEEFCEMIVESAALQPAGFLSVEGTCTLFAQASLYLIDAADDMKDPSADARVIVAGFMKFPADMGEAGDGGDCELGMPLDEGLIGAQAVAL